MIVYISASAGAVISLLIFFFGKIKCVLIYGLGLGTVSF